MQSALILSNPMHDQGSILIEQSVISLIQRCSQKQDGWLESGGILLGYRRGAHLHIVDATTPLPEDLRLRSRFFRRDSGHQEFATKQWELSNNTMDYIGEWHSHSELEPTPSPIDKSEWRKICIDRQADMMFLIAGWSGDFWVGVGQRRHVKQATILGT